MGKKTGVYKKFRDNLSTPEQVYFDSAPDLHDPDFSDAFVKTLYAQYIATRGQIDQILLAGNPDTKLLKLLVTSADNLISQIRMLKTLVSQPGMAGKRPTRVTMTVFEQVEGQTPPRTGQPGGQ